MRRIWSLVLCVMVITSNLSIGTVDVRAEEVMIFNNAPLEADVIEALGKESGPVTVAEAAELTTLTLDNPALVDLSGLEFLTGLTTLKLRSGEVTDLSPIGQLTQLQHLRLEGEWGTPSKFSDLSVLSGLTQLKSFTAYWISSTDVNVVENFTQLTDFTLFYSNVEDVSVLSTLVNLESVDIGQIPTEVSVGVFTEMPNLTKLHFTYLGVVDAGEVQNMPQLRDLSFAVSTVDDFSGISSLTDLQRLTLVSVDFHDLSMLAELTELTNLYIAGNYYGDEYLDNVESLINNKKLDWLWLPSNGIDNIDFLLELPELSEVDLSRNELVLTEFSKATQVIDTLVSRGIKVTYDNQQVVDEVSGNDLHLTFDDIPEGSDSQEVKDKVIEKIDVLTEVQKGEALNVDEITNYSEYALTQSTVISKEVVDGVLAVSESDLADSMNKADALLVSLNTILADNGIELNRTIDRELKIKADNVENKVKIRLDESLQDAEFDKLIVATGNIHVALDESIINEATQSGSSIEIVKQENITSSLSANPISVGMHTPNIGRLSYGQLFMPRLSTTSIIEKYQINFIQNEQKTEKIESKLVVGLAPDSADPDFSSFFVEKEGSVEAIGGNYNKKNGKLEIKTNISGIYYVMENKKSFDDVNEMDSQTKRAIEVLAAKGMINGKSQGVFDPKGTISRAEFTKIIVRALYLTDDSAVNSFTDVPEHAWYKVYVASSKKAGLINGYTDGTFKPSNVITKQEMIKICAASLYEQKGYQYPANVSQYTGKYEDNVAGWVQKYVALADREGVILLGENPVFAGEKGMTRADAAMMLYRLFNRL